MTIHQATEARVSLRRSAVIQPIRMCIPRRLAAVEQTARDSRIASLGHPAAAFNPASAVGPKQSWWAPGSTLRVRFLDGDPLVHARVSAIAQEWMRYANIGLVFGTDPNAEIRVSFDLNDGSWSYIGTDNLGIPHDRATMNYGWLTPTSSEWEYRRVVLHEFGHALGLSHEHQSPVGGIPWDNAAVYAYYKRTQDWDPPQVDQQVLTPLNATQTDFTAWDRDSIMEYPIDDALTVGQFSVDWNQELSRVDREFISGKYPRPIPCVGAAHTAVVARESQHLDVFWIAPDGSVMSSWWHEGQAWSAPFAVTPAGVAQPGAIAAVARESDHLDVFWVARDGSVMTTWWHEGQGWAAPFAITGANSADASAIDVVARETGHLDVFWVSTQNQVMSVWWHEGQSWSAPFTLGEPFSVKPGAVRAVARQNNHLDVFWITERGEVATAWWHEGQSWSSPALLSGRESAEPGSVCAIARLSSHLDVFWVSPEGEVRSVWWHEGGVWSSPFAIAGAGAAQRPGAVTACARTTHHLDLFWTGQDGSLQSAWWHEANAWSAPFAVAAGDVTQQRSLSVRARLANHLDVFFAAGDGSLQSVWWHAQNAWSGAFALAGARSVAI